MQPSHPLQPGRAPSPKGSFYRAALPSPLPVPFSHLRSWAFSQGKRVRPQLPRHLTPRPEARRERPRGTSAPTRQTPWHRRAGMRLGSRVKGTPFSAMGPRQLVSPLGLSFAILK